MILRINPVTKRLVVAALVLVAVFLPFRSITPISEAAHASLPIYSDSLVAGWSDWSSGSGVNWADTTNPHSPLTKPKTENVAVTVAATADQHAISPYIYGVAWAGSNYLKQTGLTLNRWGGDPTSRYNWRLGSAMNTASDWYFENTNDGYSCHAPGCAVDQMVSGDKSAGAASLITVPTLGWVAKNSSLDTCGFSVSKYGPQSATDPYRNNCGNGYHTNGKPITGNDPRDTSVKNSPAEIGAWIRHLVATSGPPSKGGVKFFAMDNEPELWYSTHRDVAPKPLTYAGLYSEFERYASVVKQNDPSAMVTGPVPWGWSAYFDSSYDYVNNIQSDRKAHGNLPIIPWFLKQVHANDTAVHKRTLDVLDIHYYPQGSGVFSGSTDAATNALRLRETRALWDPRYTDQSWINARVDLIPRMQGWIKQYYPGTKLGISEWNFGADGTMNGALAIANALGTYGREGIYLASYWTHTKAGSPGQKAFDMYRNYNGTGSKFGDVSVKAASGDTNSLMSFAAIRNSDHALTLMLVNQKPQTQLTTSVSMSNFAPAGSAQVYRLDSAFKAIQHLSPIAATDHTSITLPPSSITLLVYPRK